MAKLKNHIQKVSIRGKELSSLKGLTVYGVSNVEGITITQHKKSEKLDEYLFIEENFLAYNPYRINVGSIGLVPKELKGLISPAYIVFKTNENVLLPEFLLKYLKSAAGLHQIKKLAGGTVRQALLYDDLCEIEIPIPSTQEQKKILKHQKKKFDVLDELFTEFEKQQSLVRRLRGTILRDAVSGKLVAQRREEEPGFELLKRIKAEKQRLIEQGELKKEKPFPSVADKQMPFQLPDGWVWCRLGDLALYSEAGKSLKCLDRNVNATEWGIIKTSSITTGVFIESENKFLPHASNSLHKIKIRKHDILFCRASGSKGMAGKSCLVMQDPEGNLILSDKTIRYHFSNLISKEFINFYNSSTFAKDYYNALNTGKSTSMNNVTRPQFDLLPFPLPPLSEQTRIVGKVNELLSIIGDIESTIEHNRREADLLMNTILKESYITSEKNNVVQFPKLQPIEDQYFSKRKALATYIINKSLDDKHFGDVKFEKILHLSDYFAIKRNLGQAYYQQPAGPYDNSFTIQFFRQVLNTQWFNRTKIGNQFVFSAGKNHNMATDPLGYFSQQELATVNTIISYFKRCNYEKPEIVSTLYSVWNNRIIRQLEITDDLLITDFYAWHSQKKKYERPRLEKALSWMRETELIPDGWGKPIDKAKLQKIKA